MTWEDAAAIALSLPMAEEGTSYGTPAIKTRGKLLMRLRPEGDSVVLLDIPVDERELLVEAEPAVFHFTDHYRDYPVVLARLEGLDPAQLRGFLIRRWRGIAPKAAVKAFDAGAAR